MMTAKLSIRRNNVMKVYEGLIESMYRGETGHKIDYPPSSSNNKE